MIFIDNGFVGISGIYKIQSILCGKCYIGSAVNLKARFRIHKHHLQKGTHRSKYLQNHFNKYGINNYEFHVLENCEKEKLLERENYFLNTILPIVPNGFNVRLEASSNLGLKQSSESIQKALATKRKNGWKPFGDYDRSKIIGDKHPNFGKAMSQETKDKISNKIKGRKHTPEIIEVIRKYSTGRRHTEEQKKAISERMKGNTRGAGGKGKKVSEASRQKISISKKGTKRSQLTKDKISKKMIKIRQNGKI